MHFPIEFLLLGLVGEGSRWIGNKGWLPPKESGMPFKSRGKVGYLGADGKPAEDETGKKLSAKEKAAIMKREEEMKAKEMESKAKPNKKQRSRDEVFAENEKLLREREALVESDTKIKSLLSEVDELDSKIRADFINSPGYDPWKSGYMQGDLERTPYSRELIARRDQAFKDAKARRKEIIKPFEDKIQANIKELEDMGVRWGTPLDAQ